MAMLARKSADLLKELRHARWLPPFNDKVIKEVMEEMQHHQSEMNKIVMEHDIASGQTEEGPVAGLLLYHYLYERNKRILLAYLNFRLNRIQELRWELGIHVPEEKLQRMHESEKEYLNQYSDFLDWYMRRYVPNCKETLNLMADAEAPEDTHLQVRVIDDSLGEIVTTDSGVVQFRKGYQVFVKRTDVEHLIRAGKLEHIKCLRADEAGGGF